MRSLKNNKFFKKNVIFIAMRKSATFRNNAKDKGKAGKKNIKTTK
jgi:hypothetical protein